MKLRPPSLSPLLPQVRDIFSWLGLRPEGQCIQRIAIAVTGNLRGGDTAATGAMALTAMGKIRRRIDAAKQALKSALNKKLDKLLGIFKQMDDGTGKVSKEGFASALPILGMDEFAPDILSALIDDIDPEGTGAISVSDIYAYIQS